MNLKPKVPNDRLRQEREVRGWSQRKLAQELDTNIDRISRWECGDSVPSPYYREKLCTLFGKDAKELGFVRRISPIRNAFEEEDLYYFSFGKLKTTWIVIDGDGIAEYSPQNIRSHFDPHPEELPEDLRVRRDQIQQQQEQKRKLGHPFQWNGGRYSLDRFVLSRDQVCEDMVLDMWFRPSDYYTFLATNMSLKENALRETYLQGVDWHSPVHYFSNSFGVSLTVITSDGYTMFTERGTNLGSRPGNYNISVSEGLSRPLDRGTRGHAPDVYRCASRGLTEELGLHEPDDFVASDIVLLSFGVDTLYSLWGLRGMVKTSKPVEEIVRHWSNGVKDKLENERIFPVKFALEEGDHVFCLFT
ncbi:MAG: helix-turn-helix transcriptional regulator [Ktedonobacteraceae bacterium]|nr:helix-turn-helix transcriptional regulator [Ktedonobacteraceae bacterium]